MAGQIEHLMLKCFIVSSTGNIIGDNFGLARKATAIAVRVLNDNGSGTFAYVDTCMSLYPIMYLFVVVLLLVCIMSLNNMKRRKCRQLLSMDPPSTMFTLMIT